MFRQISIEKLVQLRKKIEDSNNTILEFFDSEILGRNKAEKEKLLKRIVEEKRKFQQICTNRYDQLAYLEKNFNNFELKELEESFYKIIRTK